MWTNLRTYLSLEFGYTFHFQDKDVYSATISKVLESGLKLLDAFVFTPFGLIGNTISIVVVTRVFKVCHIHLLHMVYGMYDMYGERMPYSAERGQEEEPLS